MDELNRLYPDSLGTVKKVYHLVLSLNVCMLQQVDLSYSYYLNFIIKRRNWQNRSFLSLSHNRGWYRILAWGVAGSCTAAKGGKGRKAAHVGEPGGMPPQKFFEILALGGAFKACFSCSVTRVDGFVPRLLSSKLLIVSLARLLHKSG